MTVLQIASNAVHARLLNADRETKLIVSDLLSYQVEGAEYTDAFKQHRWDGRSSFFDFRTGGFPAGFVHSVYSELTRRGHRVQLIRRRPPGPLGPENPKIDDLPEDPRYDYQPETVRRLLKYGSMIAQVATGGGKSRIAKLAIARIRRPTLFLTRRGVLMYQMKEALEKDGAFVCGVIGDSEWAPRKGVNVGMVQTLISRLQEPDIEKEWEFVAEQEKRLRENDPRHKPRSREELFAAAQERAQIKHLTRLKTIKFLEYIEFVIGEEAHEAGSNDYYEILRHCKNANYRLALTATPFMRQDAESNMRLMACFGQIGIRVTEKMLIERGILARPYFKRVRTPCPPKVRRTSGYQRAYKYGIVENVERNRAIVYEAAHAAAWGLTSMVLVQRKEHGKILKDMMKAAGLRVDYIFGEHDQERRKKALARLGAGEIDCLIGSTILDVGVDVPAVGAIILAGGGKAEVALRQRIGRGLRAKKHGPNVALITDFCDEWNVHLKAHAQTRHAIVDNTPGFAENVLLPGEDFDYEGLGFVKMKLSRLAS